MKNYLVLLAMSTALAFTAGYAQAEVQLTAQQRDNLGIKTTVLTTTEVGRTYSATAQVLDATPLVTLLSDLRAAQVAAAASHSELERAQKLHADEANVSLKVVEAARTQSAADTGRVNALRVQLVSTWGRSVAALQEIERDRLIADLLASHASLLRAELRQSDNVVPQFRQARVHALDKETLNNEASWPAQIIGLAAQAPQGFGHAYLLRVNTGLQAGQMFTAELIDPRKTTAGIKIPRSAIVRWQGSTWVFTDEENKFTRRIIHPLAWLDDGCLVQEDLQAGQHIVTAGAAMLLAAESTGATQE